MKARRTSRPGGSAGGEFYVVHRTGRFDPSPAGVYPLQFGERLTAADRLADQAGSSGPVRPLD